jgi:molybdenum cofactor cytidylyltransferase
MRAAGVILAAGAGRRMGGRCKAALPLGEGTFLDAVVAAARAGGVADLVCVVAAPHAAETSALARARDVRVVENAAPERGMISSIVAGLDALAGAGADAALVWPVDCPYVRAPTVAAVVAAAARDRIVVPTFAGRGGHPTAFGAALWGELRDAASARDVVAADAARVVRLAVADEGVVRDVDA